MFTSRHLGMGMGTSNSHISSYSRYIGRVGALAAALGIGVMVFAPPGVATADTSGSTAADAASVGADSAGGATGTGTAGGAASSGSNTSAASQSASSSSGSTSTSTS